MMKSGLYEHQRSRMVPQCPVCKEGCRIIYRATCSGRIVAAIGASGRETRGCSIGYDGSAAAQGTEADVMAGRLEQRLIGLCLLGISVAGTVLGMTGTTTKDGNVTGAVVIGMAGLWMVWTKHMVIGGI